MTDSSLSSKAMSTPLSSVTIHHLIVQDALTEIRRRLKVSDEVGSDGTLVDTDGLALVLDRLDELERDQIENKRLRSISTL